MVSETEVITVRRHAFTWIIVAFLPIGALENNFESILKHIEAGMSSAKYQ